GNISENFWGELAARETEWLLRSTHDEWPKAASRMLSRELPGNQIRNFVMGGLNQAPPLQERYNIEAPDFAQAAGDLLLFRPSLFASRDRLTRQDETRAYTYQFSHVRSQRSIFNFQQPEGYVAEALPESENVDLSFATFRAEVTIEGDTLRYVSVYEIKK